MPDRILRANILTSDSVNILSWPGEVFYRRLMSVVDDFGRYDARPDILRADLYALRLDNVSKSDVVKWMNECSEAGLVRLYSTDGREYLELLKFNQRLRIQKSKFPAPADICGQMTADVRNLRPEEKRRDLVSETETRERDSTPEVFKNKGEDVLFTIEHCITVALNDERWARANKTSEKELKEFNSVLEQRGIYEKNPMDYKSHFSSWKKSGKKDEPKINNGLPHNIKTLNPDGTTKQRN